MNNERYNFVSGKKLGYYDVKITHDYTISYFQISNFERFDNENYNIRSYLFKSNCDSGGCCFEYVIKQVRDYQLSKSELEEFKQVLKDSKNTPTHKVMYKFLNYVDFTTVPPPDGSELSQCNSELLK